MLICFILFAKTKKKVAIVGSGPAGLACAYHASRFGHEVEVFEKEDKVGGMLRYGIPSYRLPREILDREIARLESMGIKFHTGKGVKDATTMQEIRQDFNAVFLATGAWKSKTLGLENENAHGVMAGLKFLKEVSSGKKPEIGKKVFVVGGGNTAIDTARTAKRLGSAVTILYRRSQAEMPASLEEIHEALKEGVEIMELHAPKRILVNGKMVTGIECLEMQLGEPDESGRRKPIPIDGSEKSIEGNTILTAIGEEIDTSILPSALHV